jgi:hypothetical protein
MVMNAKTRYSDLFQKQSSFSSFQILMLLADQFILLLQFFAVPYIKMQAKDLSSLVRVLFPFFAV